MSARASLIALSFLALLTTAEVSAATKATLTLTGPGGRTLPVASLEGEERLSRLFRFIVAIPTTDPGAIPFDAFLGQAVTVSLVLPNGSTRYFNGISSRISQGSSDKSMLYRIEVVPQLWLLTRTSSSRTFQDLSVPDILRRVLTERGISFQLNLQGTYQPRDFVLQYRETDFEFVSRLMEEEGIFYFFQHGAAGHTLVARRYTAESSRCSRRGDRRIRARRRHRLDQDAGAADRQALASRLPFHGARRRLRCERGDSGNRPGRYGDPSPADAVDAQSRSLRLARRVCAAIRRTFAWNRRGDPPGRKKDRGDSFPGGSGAGHRYCRASLSCRR